MVPTDAGQVELEADLESLYSDFASHGMVPLWTALGDLMPTTPKPRAAAQIWRWADLYPLAERAGELVPVGRGGERRAIALANRALDGQPFITPTLWAAIQYLGPREVAPEHRHSQNAFRFVLEGDGVWTVVDGDPVAMRRGDLLITAGGRFHGHHNATDQPMAWLDGLDIPLQFYLDSTFFEFGSDVATDFRTPERSRSELHWAHPGLMPVGAETEAPGSVLAAYRWANTDAALSDLLADADRETAHRDHVAVRFTNPANGEDVLPTIRCEMHRVRARGSALIGPAVGSSVWQVFQGSGTARIGAGESAVEHRLEHGDVFVAPSWAPLRIDAGDGLDLFSFSDAPVIEKLGLNGVLVDRARHGQRP